MDYEHNHNPEININENGNSFTKLNGRYHSFNDQPAIIYTNGGQEWWKEGRIHRDSYFPGREDDLPAVICVDGHQEWYKEGKRHRDSHFPVEKMTCRP